MRQNRSVSIIPSLLVPIAIWMGVSQPGFSQNADPSVDAADGGAALERLRYQNPGLVVDLGVGLWAWPLPMDFDGDGDLDLVVNCPDKPSNGVYFFENAAGDTAVNPLPVFRPGKRISKGLQNVQVSYIDQQPEVLSPGMRYPDFRTTGLDAGVSLNLPANVHPNRVRANMWRLVDFDADGRMDVIVGAGDWTDYGWDNAWNERGEWTNGPLRGFVYLIRNSGTSEQPSYEQPEKLTAAGAPIEVFGWPSPNFADFDHDGDLDLICGEFLDGFTWFRNAGTRSVPQYEAGIRLTQQDGTPLTMDLQMITPTAIDWDRDGDQDLIVGDEDGRVAFVEHSGRLNSQGVPLFQAPVYFQQEADELKFGALATPVGFDWDGDGDDDIISGNTAGYIGFFENLSGPGVEKPRWAAPVLLQADGRTIRIQAGHNGSIQGPCEAKWGYTTQTVADWDHDGLPDIVASSILGKVHWYRNVGSRQNPKLAAAQPVEVEWQEPQPELAWGWLRPEGKGLLTQWRTTPVAVDWNRDGLNDLVMLDQEGFLACFFRDRVDSKLVLGPPQRIFFGDNFSTTDSRHNILSAEPGPVRLNQGIAGRSGRRKLTVTDWDGDGHLDVLANAANAVFLRNLGPQASLPSPSGSVSSQQVQPAVVVLHDMGLLVRQNIEGHDVGPTTIDLNGDEIPDFLGGAEDGRFYYLRNPKSAAKATP